MPLSFNLWGIVQFVISWRNALFLVSFYGIIYSLINKNLTEERKMNKLTKEAQSMQICYCSKRGTNARIGDKTLTRRFRVGSLARRGKFPSRKETPLWASEIASLWNICFARLREADLISSEVAYRRFHPNSFGFHPAKQDFIKFTSLAGIVFILASLFLFVAVKYKSFTLYPFRSIYGVSFNFWFAYKIIDF